MELAPGPIQLRNSGVSRTFQTNNSQEGPTRDKLVNCNKDTDLENVDGMFGVSPLDVGDRPPRVPGDRGPTMDSRPQPPRQTSVRDRQSGLGLVDYYTTHQSFVRIVLTVRSGNLDMFMVSGSMEIIRIYFFL